MQASHKQCEFVASFDNRPIENAMAMVQCDRKEQAILDILRTESLALIKFR